MIDKKMINKMVSKVLHSRGGQKTEHNIMHPKRDWFIGLFVGLVILVAVGWWNVTTYTQYSEVSVGNEEALAGVVVYRESLVKSALSDFRERAEKYDSLKKELSGSSVTMSYESLDDSSTSTEISVGTSTVTRTNEEDDTEGGMEEVEETEVAEEDKVEMVEGEDGSETGEGEVSEENEISSDGVGDGEENESQSTTPASPNSNEGVLTPAF